MAVMREVMFTGLERFWHWGQALLIISMMVTGFEVNGAYSWLGYETAASTHRLLAWMLIGLWIFIILWHLITGEWRQYIPTSDKLLSVMRYYSVDIFDPDTSHPYKKTRKAKHNPMQRLAYLASGVLIMPVIWVTGLLYMFYADWPRLGLVGVPLGLVAGIHTAAAFALLAFLIAHVYMGFTGRPWYSYPKAMITGAEEVEEEPIAAPSAGS